MPPTRFLSAASNQTWTRWVKKTNLNLCQVSSRSALAKFNLLVAIHSTHCWKLIFNGCCFYAVMSHFVILQWNSVLFAKSWEILINELSCGAIIWTHPVKVKCSSTFLPLQQRSGVNIDHSSSSSSTLADTFVIWLQQWNAKIRTEWDVYSQASASPLFLTARL